MMSIATTEHEVLPIMFIHCDCPATIAITNLIIVNADMWNEDMMSLSNYWDGMIFIDYVKPYMNLANSLTKPMGRKLILQTSN